jgi:hypothetical protein
MESIFSKQFSVSECPEVDILVDVPDDRDDDKSE